MVTQKEVDIKNAETSRKEVKLFLSKKPKRYVAYLSMNGREIQTWTGEKLGTVFYIQETRIRGYETKYSIKARGINGRTYRGIGEKGGYIKLRS